MKKTAFTWPETGAYPVAEIKPYQRTLHGDTVIDNYYWLNDFFKEGPDSEQVIDYLTAENTYTDRMMAGTKQFQEKLFHELKGRIKEKDESVPVFDNGYYYYSKTEEGKEYYKICRKKGSLDAPEEVILDVDKEAEGHSYFSLSGCQISPDNTLVAYGVDTVSRRQYTIHFKNLETGEIYEDAITGTSGDFEWAADNRTLFYTWNNPETLLTEKIKRHQLGTDTATDPIVYDETDPSNYIGINKSKSGDYLFIVSSATLSSEIRFLKSSEPEAEFQVFQPRMKDVIYDVVPLEDRFLIITNWEAQNFRLMESPLTHTQSTDWKEIIPNRPDVLLNGVSEFKDFLVFSERKNGLPQIRIQNRETGTDLILDFGEAVYNASIGQNPDYYSKTLRYSFASFITPGSVFDYDMVTGTRELKKQREVLGGFDGSNYESERLTFKAQDGTSIPVSIVYRKGFEKNGEAPLLLYAYGSYGYSMDVNFSGNIFSLIDRGFAYAIAHIRGGEEMGRAWYEDGKMMKKKNTFTDFIDCAEGLISANYTNSEHLYAMGGSAGGLLMGAIVNMRPDLWKGIIAQVPFVDVVNTMLDESIPLTTNEFDEWGNPKEQEAYEYIKSYSPYENVEKKDYPNILVTTGLHDSQVQYFEPAKWVAKLRTEKTDQNILLLHTNMEFGHGGASGRFDYLKEVALTYAFFFALEGYTEE